MESNSQDKKTLLELIALINDKMKILGITGQSKLADKSNVPRSVVNRLLKDERSIAAHNLYPILKTLNLLSVGSETNINQKQTNLFFEKSLNKYEFLKQIADISEEMAENDFTPEEYLESMIEEFETVLKRVKITNLKKTGSCER